MDPKPLVTEQVEAGKRMIGGLRDAGIPVAIAFWHRPDEESRWQFVVATPLVEQGGPFAGIEEVVGVRRSFGPEFGIDWSDLTVIGGSHPLAVKLLDLQRRSPSRYGWEEKPLTVTGWQLGWTFPQSFTATNTLTSTPLYPVGG